MDVLQEILGEIRGNTCGCRAITEAYAILFEDVASTAAHRAKRVIRELFPQLANKWDEVAVDDAGRPILTMSGKRQTYIEYFERNIRNFFFHDGADQKFEPGVARIAYGELNMENRGQDSRRLAGLKQIVKLISDGHANEYDWNLNGMSYAELETRFGASVQKADDDLKSKLSSTKYDASDYVIKEIPDFNTAKAFYKYTNPNSPWCITHMKNMWDSYTYDGMNKVYFAYKPKFKKVERIVGENAPLDEYGLSLISIIVDPWENLRAVTTRWNHENGGTDQAMDARQLSELLGGNVFELCPPPTKPEPHIDRVDEDSVRIDNQIWMCHNLQMPADPENGIYVENGETYFTWNAAKWAAHQYGGGWRLPSIDDWEQLAYNCGGSSNAGKHLKSTSGWFPQNGLDTYGFDGKPTGYYSPGDHMVCDKDHTGYFWSSIGGGNRANAYYRSLHGYYTDFAECFGSIYDGLSVRLVKDA